MRVRIGDLEIGHHHSQRPGPILVRTFEPAGAEVRTQDNNRLGRDGVTPGRDFLGAATWALELSTNVEFASEARDLVEQLQQVWHDPSRRLSSGGLTPLDFQINGDSRWRRVFGRPRNFDPPDGGLLMSRGRADFGAEFEVLDPRFFSGAEEGLHEHTLTHEGEVTGGWVFPVVFPLESARATGQRQGALTNSGSTNTPVSVTFHGPVVDPVLSSGTGWEVSWRGELAYDERLEIDPMTGTVELVRGNGSRVPAFYGMSRRTQLSRISIPPGLTNVFFSGADDTNRSQAVVQWRDAFTSF